MITRAALSLMLFSTSFLLQGSNHPKNHAVQKQKAFSFSCPPVATELQQVQKSITSPIKVASLTYTSDIYIQPDEFYYLVGFTTQQKISAFDIQQSVNFLAKKNKFNRIVIEYSIDKKGIHLNYVLTSFWTFKKVTIKGLLTGREKYKQLYLVEPGEIFDELKHKHSLEKLKEEFKRLGYFNVTIADTFTYDEAHKEVYVVLTIKSGRSFKVSDVNIKFVASATQTEEAIPYSLGREERDRLMKDIERKFINFIEGRAYSSDELNKRGKSLKKVLANHGFLLATIALTEKVNHEDRAVELEVKITLGPKKQFIFFGNHFYSSHQLLENILAFGQSTLSVPASLLADEIQRLYHKKGFWQVKVKIKEEDDKVFFIIQEGQRAIIEDVEMKGVHAFEERHLRYTYFGELIKQKYIDNDIVRQQIDALITHYKNEGFWDIAVLNHVFIPRDEQNQVLVLHIEEGPKYYIRAMTIPGYGELEDKGPFRKINGSKEPLAFDIQYLTDAKKYLLDYFHKQGYLYIEVKPQLNVEIVPSNAAQKFVSVTWQITFHEQQVHFGKTVVSGITPLPFRRLLRHLNYKEGELWSKQKIDNSIMNMRDLELFEGVHLHPENIAQPSPTKPMILKLEEDDPFEIRLRGGVLGVSRNLTWREGATYKFGGSFLYKNPFKQGGQLRFDGDITLFERYISLYYRYPWLFGLPYRTTIKGYSNKYTQPVIIGSNRPLYIATQQGGVIGINHKHKGWTLGFNLGLEWMKTSLCSLAAARAIDFAPSLVDQHIPYIYIEPSIVIDYLDDKLNPTSGSFTVASLKGMFPLKRTTTFLKILIDQSLFIPLYRSLVGGFRLKVGHIFNQRFNQIMPPERFFLGGAFSLRGYEPDFAPPLGSYVENGKRQFVPQGGKSMVNANIELRFPVYDKISGALFQDAGVLIGDHMREDIRTRGVAATGAGVRYNTPIGPLRFDLGFKWKKFADNDSRVAWFLTLGNAF